MTRLRDIMTTRVVRPAPDVSPREALDASVDWRAGVAFAPDPAPDAARVAALDAAFEAALGPELEGAACALENP